MVANANPMAIAYTWTKDGQPLASDRIAAEGPILNVTRLARSDAGIYTCQATNTQGTALFNVTVVVECKYICSALRPGAPFSTSTLRFYVADGATIRTISENTLVSPGDEAVLSCQVEGKPLTEDHVRWERAGYDMSAKTTTTFANGTSFLHIRDAQRADVGDFRCVADNRVANPTSRDVLLIVKCKLRRTEYLKKLHRVPPKWRGIGLYSFKCVLRAVSSAICDGTGSKVSSKEREQHAQLP